MSVLIRGMEMPENCYDCPFVRASWGNDYYCAKGNGTEDNIRVLMSKRMDDCPLIEVPTPHGRLGDLDALEKGFKRAIGTYLPKDPTRHMSVADGGECRGWTQALTAVLEAKTIIEAED